MTRRSERVADLIRAGLSEILLREVGDPRVAMASISGVELSPDLRHARIRVSVIGEEAERQAAVEALRHAAGFVRRRLARRLRLRVTPELVFQLDRGAEHSQRIADLLEALHDNDESS